MKELFAVHSPIGVGARLNIWGTNTEVINLIINPNGIQSILLTKEDALKLADFLYSHFETSEPTTMKT